MMRTPAMNKPMSIYIIRKITYIVCNRIQSTIFSEPCKVRPFKKVKIPNKWKLSSAL